MSAIADRLTNRIVEEDLSFRSKMLAIAAGMDNVIAMGRGDPDFHTPAHIAEAAKKAIDGNQHHYTPPTGIPALREAIAADLNREYGFDYKADEIIVTAGVQESITLIMLALIRPGDEVLITSPRFMTYDTAVNFAGGVPVPVPTFQKDDFALDIAEIEKRDRPPEPGDDILLSVITDGRHAAIDLRLVDADNDNEADNKLNALISNAFDIWRATAGNAYVRHDGKPFELPGAAQMSRTFTPGLRRWNFSSISMSL